MDAKAGRPSKNTDQKLYESKLYCLLQKSLPSEFLYADGFINTESLRKHLKCARFSVYRWLKEGRISGKTAKKLVLLSEKTNDVEKKGKLTALDLFPYLT